MRYIDLKNKKNTAQKTPPPDYSSWLDFWQKKKGKVAIDCEVMNCEKKADVGGHVIKSGYGPTEYILPMCYTCNNKPENEEFKGWESDLVKVS